jgi:hypothetical protein
MGALHQDLPESVRPVVASRSFPKVAAAGPAAEGALSWRAKPFADHANRLPVMQS